MTTPEAASPRWGGTVKALVALTGLVLVAALLVRFQGIVPLLVLAGIISYLARPRERPERRSGRTTAQGATVYQQPASMTTPRRFDDDR